ncbi:MAG: hypothetical protein LAO55_01165 [Acidobacteriia bacterium]|nr:hypothetical protein [Terriglobia bacterium]
MRQLRWFFAIIVAVPAFLDGGPIYGVILFNSQAVRGAAISIACPGAPPANGSTLDDGSYRVPVPRQGRCTFTVKSGNIQASAEVVSLQDAAQYNFVVVAAGGGYELRRR